MAFSAIYSMVWFGSVHEGRRLYLVNESDNKKKQQETKNEKKKSMFM